jgi:hypothetical protein
MITAEVYHDVFNRAVPGMLEASLETGRKEFDATFATCCSLLAGFSVMGGLDVDAMLATFDWPPEIKGLFQAALNATDTSILLQKH